MAIDWADLRHNQHPTLHVESRNESYSSKSYYSPKAIVNLPRHSIVHPPSCCHVKHPSSPAGPHLIGPSSPHKAPSTTTSKNLQSLCLLSFFLSFPLSSTDHPEAAFLCYKQRREDLCFPFSIFLFAYEKFGVFFNLLSAIRTYFLCAGFGLPVRAWRHTGVCNWHQKSRG